MSKTQCLVGCGRPVRDATLCTSCTTKLERDLGDLPGLAEDLEIAQTRQSVMGTRYGAASNERPLPWDERASKATEAVRAALTAIIHSMNPQQPPGNNLTSMSRWLLMHTPDIRQRDDADDIVQQVKLTLRAARWVIDRPGDNWYAGPCRAEYATEPALTAVTDTTCNCICHIGGAYRPACDTPGGCGLLHQVTDPEPNACCVIDLYAKHDADTVRCRNCGTEHDTAERQAWLLDAARDTLAHAELIGRAAPNLGIDITPSAIRGYALRGRLAAKSVDRDGRPLYRVGDVIDLANEAMTRRAERDAKRSA